MKPPSPLAQLPDVRDGLTPVERTVLRVLQELQQERPGRYIATAELYGRVVEHHDLSQDELIALLQKLGANRRR